jgi:hypothetical protein
MNGPNRTEGARPWLGRARKARKAGCRVKPGMTGLRMTPSDQSLL